MLPKNCSDINGAEMKAWIYFRLSTMRGLVHPLICGALGSFVTFFSQARSKWCWCISLSRKNTMLIGFYVVCDNDLCAGFSPFMGETDGETFSNINRWLVNNQTSPNSAIILIFCTGLFCFSVWTMTSRSQSLTTSPARQRWANNPHVCPSLT